MIQSIAKKDQRRIQMESDLKEHRLPAGTTRGYGAVSFTKGLLQANGRFPGVEGKVFSLGSIHKLFGQRNK